MPGTSAAGKNFDIFLAIFVMPELRLIFAYAAQERFHSLHRAPSLADDL